jgi:hypothetical protein
MVCFLRSAGRCHSGAVAYPMLFTLLTLLFAATTPLVAQTGAVSGHVVSAATHEPVSGTAIEFAGLPHLTYTDEQGFFRLAEIPAGAYTLRVRHLAYGVLTVPVTIAAGETTRLRLELSDTAIALMPLEVAVAAPDRRGERAAGTRRNVVTRQQIAQALGTNLTLGEVLRQFVPGVRVRQAEGVVGTPMCIELRSIASGGNRCLSPAVFLDGVPIQNPMNLYAGLPVQMIETLEVVPASEAGARYGTGSLYGALLIQTRRPGPAYRDPAPAALGAVPLYYDWRQEPRGHARGRAFAGALVGNAAGLAAGMAAAQLCLYREAPEFERLGSTCSPLPTIGVATAALALPALGAGLGSSLGGGTAASRGRVVPAAIGATMALVPAYSLLLASHRMDSELLLGFSVAMLATIPPLLTTVSDRRYRTARPEERH